MDELRELKKIESHLAWIRSDLGKIREFTRIIASILFICFVTALGYAIKSGF